MFIYLFQDTLTLWPGEIVTLSVNIEDQYGNPTYVILRLIDEKSSSFDQISDDTGGSNPPNAPVSAMCDDLVCTVCPTVCVHSLSDGVHKQVAYT